MPVSPARRCARRVRCTQGGAEFKGTWPGSSAAPVWACCSRTTVPSAYTALGSRGGMACRSVVASWPPIRLLWLSGWNAPNSASPGLVFERNASFATVARPSSRAPTRSNPTPQAERHVRLAALDAGARLREVPRWRTWLIGELGWSANALPEVDREARTTAERMREFYTPRLKARVETWAAADMAQFGYAPYRL